MRDVTFNTVFGEAVLCEHVQIQVNERRDLLRSFAGMEFREVAIRVFATGRNRLLLQMGEGWLVFERVNKRRLVAKTFVFRPNLKDKNDLFYDAGEEFVKVERSFGQH
jgi:hypothetical protein